MSRLERIPPSTPIDIFRQSEPELHTLANSNVSFVNVNRNKRLWDLFSNEKNSKLEELKTEIKDMLAS